MTAAIFPLMLQARTFNAPQERKTMTPQNIRVDRGWDFQEKNSCIIFPLMPQARTFNAPQERKTMTPQNIRVDRGWDFQEKNSGII